LSQTDMGVQILLFWLRVQNREKPLNEG